MRINKYLIALGLVYYYRLYDMTQIQQIFSDLLLLKKIIIGFVLYGVLDFLLLKRWQNIMYLRTHTHEFTHSVAAMVANKKIHQLAANEKDGHVMFSGGNSWFVTLTPYFLPIYTLLLLPLRFYIGLQYVFAFDCALLFIYAFHLHTFSIDFSYKQPDLKQHGYFLSTIYIMIGNAFCITLTAVLMTL